MGNFRRGVTLAKIARRETADGSWQVTLKAFKLNALIYSTIGATITASHKEVTGMLWWRKERWAKRPVEFLSVLCQFEGFLPNAVPSAAERGNKRLNASSCDSRLWAAGFSISMDASRNTGLPDPGTTSPGAGSKLDVRKVRAHGTATIGNETVRLGEVVAQ